jgi:hypothetical protein
MTAKEAKEQSNHGKWCKISSTITEEICEKCNEGETSIYIKRSELRLTDIIHLRDLGYEYIPDDDKNEYCYISWE